MGPLDLHVDDTAKLILGEVKVVLDDDALPDFDELVRLVNDAHARGRGVAVHCVTLVQLRFAIEALRLAGVRHDRIEHASVAPPDAISDLRELGIAVATQPGFVAQRGDEYVNDVDVRDVPALYPIASLLAAGVRTLGSSDAPFGPADPWEAMRAAVFRRAPSGTVVGPAQRITPGAALGLFGGANPVRVGMRADLVLLALPLAPALERLQRDDVALTVVGGEPAYEGR
jgi:predicted amidohydrolase YtcJ